ISKTHDAEADATYPLRECVDFLERILVGIDDVVEQVRGKTDVVAERVPIELAILYIQPDVDAAEVAHVVREEWLLAAGVGGLVRTKMRHGVVLVRFVDEEAARLTGAPRAQDHLVPHFVRVELAGDFLGTGI